MGCPTKVQLIQRQDGAQWYINFPAPIARAMEFEKGEVVHDGIHGSAPQMVRRRCLHHRAKSTGIRDLAINHDHYLYGHPKVRHG
ncbi:MAG: hypothetical protein V1790_04365 [Planctomycetota bacterium]